MPDNKTKSDFIPLIGPGGKVNHYYDIKSPYLNQGSTRSYETIDNKLLTNLMKHSGGSSGITPENLPNFIESRARRQSTGDRIGNALMQTGAEFIGGSLEGVGGILDGLGRLVGINEGYSRGFLSSLGHKIGETTREAFPIYMTRQAQQGSLWERMQGGGYWAQLAPSILGSAASIMVPARAASLLLGKILVGGVNLASKSARASKLLKLGTEIGKARAINNVNKFNDIVSSAIISRTIDSSREAYETKETQSKWYRDNYNIYLAKDNEGNDKLKGADGQLYDVIPENVNMLAEEYGNRAAEIGYKYSMANILFDIVEWTGIIGAARTINNSTRNAIRRAMATDDRFAAVRALSAIPEKNTSATIKQFLKSGGGALAEMADEMTMSIAMKEGQFAARKEYGLLSELDDISSFNQRFSSYIQDADVLTEGIAGLFGGIGMQAAMPVFEKLVNKKGIKQETHYLNSLAKALENIRGGLDEIATDLSNGDIVAAKQKQNELVVNALVEAYLNGTNEFYTEMIDNMSASLNELKELKKRKENGETLTEQEEQALTAAGSMVDNANIFEQIYNLSKEVSPLLDEYIDKGRVNKNYDESVNKEIQRQRAIIAIHKRMNELERQRVKNMTDENIQTEYDEAMNAARQSVRDLVIRKNPNATSDEIEQLTSDYNQYLEAKARQDYETRRAELYEAEIKKREEQLDKLNKELSELSNEDAVSEKGDSIRNKIRTTRNKKNRLEVELELINQSKREADNEVKSIPISLDKETKDELNEIEERRKKVIEPSEVDQYYVNRNILLDAEMAYLDTDEAYDTVKDMMDTYYKYMKKEYSKELRDELDTYTDSQTLEADKDKFKDDEDRRNAYNERLALLKKQEKAEQARTTVVQTNAMMQQLQQAQEEKDKAVDVSALGTIINEKLLDEVSTELDSLLKDDKFDIDKAVENVKNKHANDNVYTDQEYADIAAYFHDIINYASSYENVYNTAQGRSSKHIAYQLIKTPQLTEAINKGTINSILMFVQKNKYKDVFIGDILKDYITYIKQTTNNDAAIIGDWATMTEDDIDAEITNLVNAIDATITKFFSISNIIKSKKGEIIIDGTTYKYEVNNKGYLQVPALNNLIINPYATTPQSIATEDTYFILKDGSDSFNAAPDLSHSPTGSLKRTSRLNDSDIRNINKASRILDSDFVFDSTFIEEETKKGLARLTDVNTEIFEYLKDSMFMSDFDTIFRLVSYINNTQGYNSKKVTIYDLANVARMMYGDEHPNIVQIIRNLSKVMSRFKNNIAFELETAKDNFKATPTHNNRELVKTLTYLDNLLDYPSTKVLSSRESIETFINENPISKFSSYKDGYTITVENNTKSAIQFGSYTEDGTSIYDIINDIKVGDKITLEPTVGDNVITEAYKVTYTKNGKTYVIGRLPVKSVIENGLFYRLGDIESTTEARKFNLSDEDFKILSRGDNARYLINFAYYYNIIYNNPSNVSENERKKAEEQLATLAKNIFESRGLTDVIGKILYSGLKYHELEKIKRYQKSINAKKSTTVDNENAKVNNEYTETSIPIYDNQIFQVAKLLYNDTQFSKRNTIKDINIEVTKNTFNANVNKLNVIYRQGEAIRRQMEITDNTEFTISNLGGGRVIINEESRKEDREQFRLPLMHHRTSLIETLKPSDLISKGDSRPIVVWVNELGIARDIKTGQPIPLNKFVTKHVGDNFTQYANTMLAVIPQTNNVYSVFPVKPNTVMGSITDNTEAERTDKLNKYIDYISQRINRILNIDVSTTSNVNADISAIVEDLQDIIICNQSSRVDLNDINFQASYNVETNCIEILYKNVYGVEEDTGKSDIKYIKLVYDINNKEVSYVSSKDKNYAANYTGFTGANYINTVKYNLLDEESRNKFNGFLKSTIPYMVRQLGIADGKAVTKKNNTDSTGNVNNTNVTEYIDPVTGDKYNSIYDYYMHTNAIYSDIGSIKDRNGKVLSNVSTYGDNGIKITISTDVIENEKETSKSFYHTAEAIKSTGDKTALEYLREVNSIFELLDMDGIKTQIVMHRVHKESDLTTAGEASLLSEDEPYTRIDLFYNPEHSSRNKTFLVTNMVHEMLHTFMLSHMRSYKGEDRVKVIQNNNEVIREWIDDFVKATGTKLEQLKAKKKNNESLTKLEEKIYTLLTNGFTDSLIAAFSQEIEESNALIERYKNGETSELNVNASLQEPIAYAFSNVNVFTLLNNIESTTERDFEAAKTKPTTLWKKLKDAVLRFIAKLMGQANSSAKINENTLMERLDDAINKIYNNDLYDSNLDASIGTIRNLEAPGREEGEVRSDDDVSLSEDEVEETPISDIDRIINESENIDEDVSINSEDNIDIGSNVENITDLYLDDIINKKSKILDTTIDLTLFSISTSMTTDAIKDLTTAIDMLNINAKLDELKNPIC